MTDAPLVRHDSLPRRLAIAGGALGLLVVLLLLEDVGGGFLNHALLYLPGADKVLHVVQSGLFLLAVRWLLQRLVPGLRAPTVFAAAAIVLLAGLDEVQQSFTHDRTVELADIVASCGGGALAAAVALRRQRRLAIGLALGGLVVGGTVTYASWERSHDVNYALRMEGAGRFVDAREAYHRAIAKGHTSGGIYNGAAWVEIESGTGDAALAVEWAARALALQPGDADTLDTYGWALYHAGRIEEAHAQLAQALAKKREIYCIHYHLATVLLAMGRRDEAVRHLQQQVAEWPQTREAARARALLASGPPM